MDQLKWKEGLSKGSEEAYYLLFYTYFKPLTAFATKLLGDQEAAKDLVQEVFGSLYEKRNDLNIKGSLKSYLFTAVNNKALNEIRQIKLHRAHHLEIAYRQNETFPPNKDLELADLQAQIDKLIEKLPARCREIFELSRFQKLSNEEIAGRLGLSKRTVETQISIALKHMRKGLKLAILHFLLHF